jgi:hypothetical protein
MAQLGGAMGRASGCKRDDGPSGRGSASVTFAPSGAVSNATIPPPFAGTSVGACLTSVYKGLRVPAFSGSPVTLSASFNVPK